MQKIADLNIPIRTYSEANIACHWTVRKKRTDQQKFWVNLYWNQLDPTISLPCVVKLTRIAPRSLDDDNLRSAFKIVRDCVSDRIKPGLAPGRADAKDITFEYDQKKGKPKEYAIKIEIFYEKK